MTRPSRYVDRMVALDIGAGGAAEDPPSSAWGNLEAPADEDAGFPDDFPYLPDADDWPGSWGAARLGIP